MECLLTSNVWAIALNIVTGGIPVTTGVMDAEAETQIEMK